MSMINLPPGLLYTAVSAIRSSATGLSWLLNVPNSLFGLISALVCLLAAIVFHWMMKPSSVAPRWNLPDLAATVFVLLQLVTAFTGVLRSNVIHFMTPCAVAGCVYFSIRLFSKSSRMQTIVFRVAASFGLLLAIVDILLFALGLENFRMFPRVDVAGLRAYFPLVGGYTHNDSLMVGLALLPFALGCSALERGRNRWFLSIALLAATSLTTVMILSFSRSIYLALAVFLIGIVAIMKWHHVPSFRLVRTYGILAALFLITAIGSFRVERSVLESLGNSTISQQRSVRARISIWQDTVRAIERHPLLGTGGFSDGFESLATLKDSPDHSFSARSFNAPLEVMLSSGALGLLAYGAFLCGPIFAALSRSATVTREVVQIQLAAILTAGLIALIVRDMFYTSIVLDGKTILIMWISIACLQNCLSVPVTATEAIDDHCE
jgi:O-antigen ligase